MVLLDLEKTLVSLFLDLELVNHWVSLVLGPPCTSFLLWICAERVYPGRRFTDYAILGDDIVIGDRLVASEYRTLMDQLHVKIYLEKD